MSPWQSLSVSCRLPAAVAHGPTMVCPSSLAKERGIHDRIDQSKGSCQLGCGALKPSQVAFPRQLRSREGKRWRVLAAASCDSQPSRKPLRHTPHRFATHAVALVAVAASLEAGRQQQARRPAGGLFYTQLARGLWSARAAAARHGRRRPAHPAARHTGRWPASGIRSAETAPVYCHYAEEDGLGWQNAHAQSHSAAAG